MSELASKIEQTARLVPDVWADECRANGSSLTVRIVSELGVAQNVAFHVATIVSRRVAVSRGFLV